MYFQTMKERVITFWRKKFSRFGTIMTSFLMIYVKYLILYNLTILTLFIVILRYFWGMGIIGMISNAFWCDLFKIVVVGGLKWLIVDSGQHLLICVSNGKTNHANRSKTSILDR